jgi:hypothetical protein
VGEQRRRAPLSARGSTRCEAPAKPQPAVGVERAAAGAELGFLGGQISLEVAIGQLAGGLNGWSLTVHVLREPLGTQAIRRKQVNSRAKRRRRRARLRGESAAALLCGVGDVPLVLGSEHFPDPGAWAIFGPAIGWSFVGTGLFAWRRRRDSRFGVLMTLVRAPPNGRTRRALSSARRGGVRRRAGVPRGAHRSTEVLSPRTAGSHRGPRRPERQPARPDSQSSPQNGNPWTERSPK